MAWVVLLRSGKLVVPLPLPLLLLRLLLSLLLLPLLLLHRPLLVLQCQLPLKSRRRVLLLGRPLASYFTQHRPPSLQLNLLRVLLCK